MTIKFSLISFVALSSLCVCAQTVTQDDAALLPVVKQNYDFRQVLASSGIPASQVSFYVQALNQTRPLLSINAQRAQNPGSTIKLITSYTALKLLGAGHQWRTEFLSQAKPDAQGVLNQPLYLKGSGDPQLVVEKIDALVQNLAAAGVKTIRAPIVLDRSIFKDEAQDAASFDGEPSMPYNAQPDAALMNFRALSFTFDSLTHQVSTTPALANLALSNSVQWVEGACPADGWKSSVALSYTAYSAKVGGRYYSECGTQQWHVHAHQMPANDYARGILKSFMAGKIDWDGTVQDGSTPRDAQVLGSVTSNPLAAVLKDMNYFSNNVMARQVYLALSVKIQGIGSLDGSAHVVSDAMRQQGLKMSTLVMGNGSGLSRVTAISAQELGKMLVKAADEPDLFESLPVVGVSGTMKNRLKDTDMVGRGHIKTGTLNDVRAIAGYIDGLSGQRYAVVSLIHGPNAQTADGKKIHDAFMQWVGAQ